MAHAERLATQVKTMSARIKELEAALTNAQQPPLPPGKEPDSQLELQDSEQTGDKYERDLDSVSKNLGSLAIDVEGKAQYHGETAGAEVRSFLSTCLRATDTFIISFCNISCQQFVSFLPLNRFISQVGFPTGCRSEQHNHDPGAKKSRLAPRDPRTCQRVSIRIPGSCLHDSRLPQVYPIP